MDKQAKRAERTSLEQASRMLRDILRDHWNPTRQGWSKLHDLASKLHQKNPERYQDPKQVRR